MADHVSIEFDFLKTIINDATQKVKTQLDKIKNSSEAISIGEMFEMQIKMNQLAQLSEMATSMTSAANGTLSSMARNVKS